MKARPARSRVAVAPDVELSLQDWGGEGPLLLLHHANGFCAGTWAEVARALGEQARVIALDARGHGDSSVPKGHDAYRWDLLAEDLTRVVQHVLRDAGRERVDLMVGHSFGGTISLGAAALPDARLRRVLALDPVILPPGLGSGVLRGNPMAAGARRRKNVFVSRGEARQAWRAKPFFARWHPGVFEDYVEEGLREREDGRVELKCAPETEATVFETGRHLDVFARAANVSIPVVIQWAEQGSFSRAVYQQLADMMAEATVETVPTGHLVPMERPDLVVERIRALLREHPL
ncbi:MAG: alpha/beta hydrolase [Myxococcales bacterium]|nr:alpha/beta hydrolase [Myxococcales bacterium]